MEEYVWISKAVHSDIFINHVHPIVYRLGQEWNVEVTIAGPADLQDEPFIQAIHDATDRQVAGMMVHGRGVHGWSVKAEIAAINAAVEKGIPVVTVDCDVRYSKRLAHVGTDWFRMGAAMADQLASLVGENGKTLFMGNVYLAEIQAGFRGFQNQMSTYPNIELFGPEDDSDVGKDSSIAGPDRAEALTLEWLEKHPDIAGIAGFDFTTGPGIANALKKNGMAGKVKVVCIDAEAPQLECINKGTIQVAFSQRRELSTYQAFQMLHAFNHGSASNGYHPGPTNITGNIDTGFIIVTRGNVDSFQAEFNLDETFERQALARRLALMSRVVESSGQMTLAVDAKGCVVYANPASLRLTDMTEEQIIGVHIDQIFSFTEENRTLIEQARTIETSASFETTVWREYGHPVPVQLTVSPMKNDMVGRGLALTAADITARKRAEEALQTSETRWQFALEGAGDGVWDWKMQTNEVFFSRQWKAMLGFEEHEIENTFDEWDRRVHPDDKESTYAALNDHLAGKTPLYASEHRMRCKDGTYRWILVRGKVMVRDEAGEPLRIVGTHTDITYEKQAIAALRQSEARYRALVESQIDLISRYRPDTTLTFVNDAYARFFGKTREELIGQSYLRWVAPDFHEQARQETLALAKNPKPISGEYLNFTADGTPRWIQWVVQGIVDEHGEVVEVQGVGRDITRLMEVEAALRESELFLRESQAVGRVGSYDLDIKTGKWVNSEVMNEILGIDEQFSKDLNALIGLVHPDQKDEMLHYLNEHVFARHNRCDIKFRILRHDNQEERWMHTLGELVFDDQGNPVKLIGTIQDITVQMQAEAEIRQLNEELEQRVIARTQDLQNANEEIKQFAYIVSHDLRAPLINLKGFASELRSSVQMVLAGFDELLPLVEPAQKDTMQRALLEDIPEALQFIESSVSSMDNFTKAILKLSRMGRLQLDLVEVDVRSLVEKKVRALAYEINQREIKVTVGDLPSVVADLISLEQVIGNILANAVAYLDPNRPGEIDISAELKADETVFTIRDNGRGIAQNDMDKVFAPFRRAGRQDIPGEGMGLAYVQTLLRRHGGRIWCESEEGVGTTFSFTIPK